MPRQELVKFAFSGGYASDIPATEPTNYLRQGSKNVLVTGSGLLKPFKGLTISPATAARGSITVVSAGSTLNAKDITVNGVTFTFVNTGPDPGTGTNIRFNTGDTLSQVATKIATKLNAYAAPVDVATYTASGPVVNVVHDTPGFAGNSFTLATGSAGFRIAMSGAKLSGGADVPTGSRVNFLTDGGYAGLGDAGNIGSGSVAKQVDLLFFIGSGPLKVNGRAVTISGNPVQATSNWTYLTRSGGTFNDSSSMYQVGHAQPARPTVYAKTPPSSGQKTMNAAVTLCIWRADSNTGQPSLPSPASDILTVTAGSVIVVFPDADNNGQDLWGIGVTLPGLSDIGNMYQLQSELGGEVLESTLAFTRTITSLASTTSGTKIITLDGATPVGDRFTNADVGRRIAIAGGCDSWITEITDDFHCLIDTNATGNVTNGTAVIRHAVNGILRAVEISWADTDILGQPLAPFDGFEPPDGNFAGNLMDTFYIEDIYGTIFYSIPNYFSFPRSRRIFTEDTATVYVDTGYGRHWRVAKQSIAQIFYSVGDKPIQAMLVSKNAGCKFPQNASLGYSSRLLAWTGRPTMVDFDGKMDSTFHLPVAAEFAGWENQTAENPVVTAYDPLGLYELWCYGNKIMAMHGPTNRWCAPILLDDWVTGTVVGQVIVNERLVLVVNSAGTLYHYQWNVGSGSLMVLESYFRETPEHQTTITLVKSVVKPGTTASNFRYSIVKNFTASIDVGTSAIASTPATQIARHFEPNIRGVEDFAIKIEGFGASIGSPIDGDAAVEYVGVWGEWNSVPPKQ